jgi:hypothetical protein
MRRRWQQRPSAHATTLRRHTHPHTKPISHRVAHPGTDTHGYTDPYAYRHPNACPNPHSGGAQL